MMLRFEEVPLLYHRHFFRLDGFSLLELLFVILIIAIVAGLAIPNLITSKKAGYEAATIGYLRSLGSAQETYRLRSERFASEVAALTESDLIERPDAARLGYRLQLGVVNGGERDWWVTATRDDPGRTGDRCFFLDGTGVIRESTDGPANGSSAPLNYAD